MTHLALLPEHEDEHLPEQDVALPVGDLPRPVGVVVEEVMEVVEMVVVKEGVVGEVVLEVQEERCAPAPSDLPLAELDDVILVGHAGLEGAGEGGQLPGVIV